MSKLLLDRRALLVAGVSATALSACSGIIGPPEAPPLYVLKPALPPAGAGRRVPWQMSIALPEAPDSLDTSRIVLVHENAQMDFYADASWQDRVPFLVQSALIEAFEGSGRITAVGRDTEGLKSDYILETDIRDFQARYDAAEAPPTVVVRIAAKLIAVRGRTIAQALPAHGEATAQQNNVPSVVAAFNQALAGAIGQIVDWALGAPMPAKTE